MTIRRLTLLAALTLGAAACSTAPYEGEPRGYGADLARLAADCRERGGILAPIPGSTTGRAETDNACQIRGGATRLRN